MSKRIHIVKVHPNKLREHTAHKLPPHTPKSKRVIAAGFQPQHSLDLKHHPGKTQRSIRLSRAYRAIYVISSGAREFVSVEEVHKHDY